jgi:DNA mismatch endonuclease Vsr
VQGRLPLPTTPESSRRMSAQLSENTKTELRLRSLLHARGLRYRVHQRPLSRHRRTADIVFNRAKVAVYLDGCCWHGCPQHGTWPKRNSDLRARSCRSSPRKGLDWVAVIQLVQSQYRAPCISAGQSMFFEAGAGPRAPSVHNRAVSHTSHTATRPLGRLRAASGLTRRHLSATIPTTT